MVHAQSEAPALALRTERALGAGRGVAPAGALGVPALYTRAQNVSGTDEILELTGGAEVRKGGAVLRADRIIYTIATDELHGDGHVRVFRDGAVFSGPSVTFKPDAQTGAMPGTQFNYVPRNAHGSARLAEFLPGEIARLTGAEISTCPVDDRSWWVKANDLVIDPLDEVARARGASLYFEGVPVFATPYFQIPLGERRRSGLLTPSFGINSRLGAEVSLPLYLNIAPNRDVTVTPNVSSRRGLLLQNEFRYLEPNWRGAIEFDTIPHDRVFGGSREHISAQNEYADARGVVGGWNYNRVSDDQFFVDFGHNIVTATQNVLPQEAYLGYNQTYWNSALRVTKNQALIDLAADPQQLGKPYERVPQWTLSALRNDVAGFDLAVASEATRFDHPTQEPGSRLIVNPSLAYPLLAPAWFVVPKVQWHATWYDLDPARHVGDATPARSLPIASLDAGLVFERPTDWFGVNSLQTLEPRLFYARIPFRDQTNLPNFDSALADFNFAQLFTENVFVGGDRIGQANQLTAALVSRVIETDSGGERLRAALGQRFYFSPQEVTLPGGTPRTDKESDVLFALSGSITRSWLADLALDHATLQNQVVQASVGIRYQPRPASVINLAYRYKIGELEQIDLSTQWPLSARWYTLARVNYSIRDGRTVETLAGFEYKSGCWVARFAAQRFATLAEKPTTAVFFSIELNGLGSVGTSPLEALQRNIPGYQLINPPPREPGRFEYYE